MYSGALPGVFPLKFVEVWPIRELIAGLPAITIRRRVKPQVSFKPLPIAARVTVILFGIMGLAAILYAFLWQTAFTPSHVLVLLALGMVCARTKVNLFRGSTISFLTCVVLLAVSREGPAVAVLVAIGGVTVQTLFPRRKVVLHQLAFNAGMIALTVLQHGQPIIS